MEILIVAIVISAISIYGAVMLKRLYFLLVLLILDSRINVTHPYL